MLRFSALAIAALVISTSAQATMVAGWEVSAKPDEKGICSIQHNYKDKADDDAANSVNFIFGKDDKGGPLLVIALGYGKWDWTKGDKPKADLLIDDTVEQRAVEWESTDPKVLLGVFEKADALIQPISQGKELILRFDGKKDDEASFEIPDAGQAIGAVQICRSQQK